jgi:hypothetical protein
MKAYAVTDSYEGGGDIYYAVHAITARRAGADEYSEGNLSGVTCKRAHWADEFAPGPCPKLVMIDHGWSFECHGCYSRLSCDGVEEHDSDGRGHIDRNRFVELRGGVFCTAECRAKERSERARLKRLQRRAVNDLVSALSQKLPEARAIKRNKNRFANPYASVERQDDGSFVIKECIVGFEWPGMKDGHGTFGFRKAGEEPYVEICRGDIPAWDAWRRSVNPNYEATTNG